MKLFKSVLVLSMLALVGCGSKVEIPPAHVGKILTKNGYAPDTLSPSKFRLPFCLQHCDKLILLEVADMRFDESMELFMPMDKLKLEIDVRGTFSIPKTTAVVDALYDNLLAEDDKITGVKVYDTYGRQALRGVVRSELVKYTIADILSQRETIGKNVHAAIQKKLVDTHTPMVVSRFELASVLPPEVIVKAQEAAKQREIDIQKVEADAQVRMVEAEKDLEVAKAQRMIEREKAEAMAEQNRIAAEAITPQVLAYKKLEAAITIYSELAKSNNVVIVPADSSSFQDITDDAVLAKLMGRELKK